jgi:hypothetical protein
VIYHVPFNEANNPRMLSAAENQIGLHSRIRIVSHDGFFGSIVNHGLFARALKRFFVFFEVLVFADVVHYNYGSFLGPTFLEYKGKSRLKMLVAKIYDATVATYCYGLDIRIFHFMKKKIYVTFQGTDLRQSVYCCNSFKIHFYKSNPELVSESADREKMKRFRYFSLYADKLFVVNPDLMHVMPDSLVFLPYSAVDVAAVVAGTHSRRRTVKNRFRIVHAPSNRKVKGTTFLEDAVNRLQVDYPQVELVLVEGLSNAQAFEVYESADLVVDQLLAGWYGGFAVECMALSKPVVSYIRVEDFCFLPAELVADLPIVSADPETVYEVLRSLVNMSYEDLLRLGALGQRYVLKWHNPQSIASFVNGKSSSFVSPEATLVPFSND